MAVPAYVRRVIAAQRKIEQDLAEDPATYLRDLAERLMRVPALYDVDQGDVDRLIEIAREIEAR